MSLKVVLNSDLQKFHYKVKRLWFFLKLVQVVIAQAVVGKHIGHPAGVNVPIHRIFPHCDTPQTLSHYWIQSGVLLGHRKKTLNTENLMTAKL